MALVSRYMAVERRLHWPSKLCLHRDVWDANYCAMYPKGRQETHFLAQCLEDFEGSTASGFVVTLDMKKEKLWRS